MQIDQLQKCPYIDLQEVKGTYVLFSVQLFSERTGGIERFKVHCPTSGNWLLLDKAKLTDDSAEIEDLESILGGLLESFEKAEQVEQKIETKEIPIDPMDRSLQEAAEAFLEVYPSNDKRGSLFSYLRRCADNFELIYDQNNEQEN